MSSPDSATHSGVWLILGCSKKPPWFQQCMAPNTSVCGYESDGSNDDVPLRAFLTSELVDFAFVDPDADGPIGDQLGVALWKDDTMTLQTQNELLCSASRCAAAMLRDTADQRAIWLDERPALRVLLRYRASVQLLVIKLVVCHYGKQPRSERKGTGLITVSGQCCEVAWEHGAAAMRTWMRRRVST